ncbi:unnamed protein product [Microthlaspi erraticum]|uniref:Uncharacterized protein n=1 Tax=Microthlaspi erraticum TaxID=1685480 RepID=A0A6D2KJ97_9BRAS|nr:unnamed protein product [Microthlaspi erraticum]
MRRCHVSGFLNTTKNPLNGAVWVIPERKRDKRGQCDRKPWRRVCLPISSSPFGCSHRSPPLARTMPTPTFSAAALDRSLKPGDSKSLEISSTKALHSRPPLSGESEQPKEKTLSRPQMSPSLYATPKEITLPNSPSSSPPSPYIVNHKARGPALFKSSSDVDVPSHPKSLKDENIQGNADVEATITLRKITSLSFPIAEDHTKGVRERPLWDCSPPHGKFWNDKSGSHISNVGVGSNNASVCLEWQSYLLDPVRVKANKEWKSEDYYNTEIEDYGGSESSHKLPSSVGEFYDARDELSSDNGSVSSNIETELREMRLSILMEIERRRQAEETLEQMQVHWRRLREQLAHVDLFVPLDPTSSQYTMNIAYELRCQLELTRFVSGSLAVDLAKAEVKMEMESELEAKNFEISRLSDRLHYYETVNQEMSQRNQDAIEVARLDGQKRKRRQRWIWGSIAATITLGGAVLAWPYLPSGISLTEVAQPIDEAP